jgi:hypothetical protein
MRRIFSISATALVGVLTFAGAAFAQSSGNVASDQLKTICAISNSDGTQSCHDPATGNAVQCPSFSTTGPLASPIMSTTIQTPSGSGTGLVITPSLDVGLYTQTKVSGTGTVTGSDHQIAGVQVTVTVDGGPVQPEVVDNGGNVTGVMYDQRFQQLSLDNIQCGAGNGGMCDISFVLSTLSAHSFNFVAPSIGGGNHSIKVYASLANPLTTQTEACFGPGTLTAVQVKAFKQN